ncbi:ABC transporter ATP-binding protein [Streptomyces sp. LBUM 1478]|uniref:ABC transporter ATP-binding protein n=1 Tax=Streptomyces TaxID=1883 RepID=UPI0005A1FD95|nr:ABC transporter ATP-binding protein [Streptomyces scabiei]MBP5905862.1 ABC transporter ATP-binding protein [Streptomyces sp. LBUM 1478]MDX2534312.1 ABC transporter ATP-binding protein [Streptomyces scabiei]MDX2575765.1 ABC transporter ATP-binding protein [Streptomyces scabiei]MDX2652018.1 ABC transporter ATP-binding protein [Streptomyces scabiei]MDX2719544.1 ABC transporter ATP-binding protein [Streptomyces scabiei]
MKTSEVLCAKGVDLLYGETPAVRNAEITLSRGEVVAITGQSGSGKSSLLYCLAGVLPVARGEVRFEGRLLADLDDEELSELRRERFGFVFQYGELLPELTVEENTALPLRLAGQRKKEAHAAAGEVLGRLGLADLRERRPSQVSGGQSQRIAVARALVHRPAVVFADEPTGSLDSSNATAVLDEFLTLARSQGTAVVLVTHDSEVADRADSRYTMRDGTLSAQVREVS